ncbi:MAG: hypothetical protein ACRDSP_09555 [Pseudonocardiaceae bacterium]
MAMAHVMSGMPDVWRKVLAEHVPDQGGRCQACRDEGGFSASWPCLTRQIAEQAKRIHDDPQPEFPPLRSADWTPEPSPPRSPAPTPLRPTEPSPLRSTGRPPLRSTEPSPLRSTEPSPLRSTGRHAAP